MLTLVLPLSLALTGCTGSPPVGNSASSPTGSDSGRIASDVATTVTAAGSSVTLPAGAAPAGSHLVVETAAGEMNALPTDVPMQPVGHPIQVRIDGGTLTGRATVTFQVPADEPAGDPLVVVWQDGSGGWRWLPTQWTPGQQTVTAETDHFSVGFLARVDVTGTARQWSSNIAGYITGRFGVPQPNCGQPLPQSEGITVTSSGGDRVKWCVGVENGVRVLKVANNLRTYSEVDYPAKWTLVHTSPEIAVSLESLARAWGKSTSLAPAGDKAVIVDGGGTITLQLPAGSSGTAESTLSAGAWTASAIVFGAEVFDAVAKAAEVSAGIKTSKSVSTLLLGGLSSGNEAVLAAMKDCEEAISSLTNRDFDEHTGKTLFKAGLKCGPRVGQALLYDGAKIAGSWFAAAVVAAVATVAGLVLTAVNLVVTSLREVWDTVASVKGKSSVLYTIVVNSAESSCPNTAVLEAALRPHLRPGDSIVGLEFKRCSGQWVLAPMDIQSVGVVDANGNPLPNAFVELFHFAGGAWQWISRDTPCKQGLVPKDLFQDTCNAS
jgi:hypothetical protein